MRRSWSAGSDARLRARCARRCRCWGRSTSMCWASRSPPRRPTRPRSARSASTPPWRRRPGVSARDKPRANNRRHGRRTRPAYGRHVALTDASGSARASTPAPADTLRPDAGRLRRLGHGLEANRDLVVDPLAGATVLVVLARPGSPVATGLLGLAAFAAGAMLARKHSPQAALLPLMRHVQPFIAPFVAIVALAVLELLTGRPHAGVLDLLAAFAASACLDRTIAAAVGGRPPGSRSAAYIGSAAGAARLNRALEAGGSRQYRLVGRVSPDALSAAGGSIPELGRLDELAAIVVRERIELLVLGVEAPRSEGFAQVVDSCLELPARLVELPALFEEVFGHVATAEIDATWFECLACSAGRGAIGAVKRALDVAGAVVVLVLLAPLLALMVALVRRDGGPGLFVQVRIGECGRPFRLYKLRTMTVASGGE